MRTLLVGLDVLNRSADNMLLRSFIPTAFLFLLLGCSDGPHVQSTKADAALVDSETSVAQTFLGNCNELRASDGFRQNVYLSFNGDGHGAICMDLERRLYLIIVTERPVRSVDYVSQRFNSLRVSPATLRRRMDPDAFIPGRDGVDRIYRIPPTADESFAADLFNDHLGGHTSPSDIEFQWD